MENYIIFTDSCCDISPEVLKEWGVEYENMTFSFEGDEREYINADISNEQFYERMKNGGKPKTSAINVSSFTDAFESVLKNGKDILYIAFSSGLSTTVPSAKMACDELKKKYPERRVVIVDTLAASAGEGMMVYLAVKNKNEGLNIEENANSIKSLESNHCIWFTVDDLEYLKRGGRVSPTVAFVGGLLGIKPVLRMDEEGHLIKAFTMRGRRKAIEALADKYTELALKDSDMPIFISHAGCKEDALTLKNIIKERHGAEVTMITEIGPVIGSHSGPGTLAFFFIGKNR